MKIAVITNSRIPSLTANSIQAMKVSQALAQLGHDIRIFAPRETDIALPKSILAHYGLRIEPDLELLPSIRPLKRLDFILYAQSAARKFDADIIYTWLPQSAALALWNNYPVILEMHADVAGRMGPWWLRQFWLVRGWKRMTVTTRALRMALERSTNIEFRSERSVALSLSEGRRTDQAVIIAPNGVDMESYETMPDPQEARRQLNLKDGLTVGFTGHIYPGRGADLLFELAIQMPQVNFLWVGGTPELVEFWRGKLNEANVVNVTMTGFVQNSRVPLYQSAADILLMPYSRSIEASSGQDIAEVINPMKMFEYMAVGRAIITADLPVIREVLNEKNAVFCEPVGEDNWESGIGNWKLAIESLLGNEARRIELGIQAREDVQGYTWTARVGRILQDL
jgi:glycosyltransferase involved in cell wall biosynthesis